MQTYMRINARRNTMMCAPTACVEICVLQFVCHMRACDRHMIVTCRDIMPAVRKNKEREKTHSAYDPSLFTRYVCVTVDLGQGLLGFDAIQMQILR